MVDARDTPGTGRLVVVNPHDRALSIWLRGFARSGFTEEVQWTVGPRTLRMLHARDLEDRWGAPGGSPWRVVLTSYEPGLTHPLPLLALQATEGHWTNTTHMLSSGFACRPCAVTVPWLPGTLRDHDAYLVVQNTSGTAQQVRIHGVDETGRRAPGDARVDLGVDASLALNRTQLETGHAPGDALRSGLGAAAKDWRLELSATLPFEVGVYSTTQARLAPLHGRAPYAGGLHHVALLNHASNPSSPSFLKLVNLADVPRTATLRGRDAQGAPGLGPVLRTLGPRETWTVSVQTLQTEGFGSGHGKWSVDVHAEPDVAVLPFATGGRGLSNLSGVLLSGPVALPRWPGARP